MFRITSVILQCFFITLCFFVFGNGLLAQSPTQVTGTVIDENDEPAISANVYFAGTTIGTTTDFDGNYVLKTSEDVRQVVVQYVGYESDTVMIAPGEENVVNFKLAIEANSLDEIIVVSKKYSKDDPVVGLIRKVQANKDRNRPLKNDFYQVDKYEKIELDLNNLTEKFTKRRIFKKFQFIFDYLDTAAVNDKAYLPLFLQETASTVYYRKKPEDKKEYKNGVKVSTLKGFMDESSIDAVLSRLYADINIYDNSIDFLNNQFVSPLANIAPSFYEFYIYDTLYMDQGIVIPRKDSLDPRYPNKERVIDVKMVPRNKLNFGFEGHMYISDDTTYRVVKVDLGISDNISLNFVKDVNITQEFGYDKGNWVVKKDSILVDYNISERGMGMFGRRKVLYTDYVFNEPKPDNIYSGTEKVIEVEGAYNKSDDFWDENRPEALTEQEAGIYVMVDTLQKVPAFRRTLKIASLLFTGYTDVGPFDVGPINAFYSFNDIEGFRLRFGGRTNLKFDEKIQLEGYGAYGFKDKQFKYYGSALYSFNRNFQDHPRHYLKASIMRETKFPGSILEYITEDNFLLSFRRGSQTNMLFFKSYRLDYYHEMRNNFSYQLIAENRTITPHPEGSLTFDFTDINGDRQKLADIPTTEAIVKLSFSPNAQYFNSKNFRYNIVNKYPVFKLYYTLGLDGLGGEYSYHQTKLNIFKRFYLSVLGYANVELEGGKIFGKDLPYMLMWLPRANQTFSYQNRAYNMMNYLEFVSDQYVSLNVRYYMQGFLFNKIPLLRRLKLREVFTFKGLYGGLTDPNNPNLDPTLIQFPTNGDGEPLSYVLGKEPYMEASVGISNIIKVLRIDLVQRLNYLDQPNVPELFGVKGMGIRARAVVEF